MKRVKHLVTKDLSIILKAKWFISDGGRGLLDNLFFVWQPEVCNLLIKYYRTCF